MKDATPAAQTILAAPSFDENAILRGLDLPAKSSLLRLGRPVQLRVRECI